MAAPVYVKIEKYKEISSIMNEIRSKINEAHEALEKIKSLKSEEEKEIAEWEHELGMVKEKLAFAESSLEKPGEM